jgi:hypothetical protein
MAIPNPEVLAAVRLLPIGSGVFLDQRLAGGPWQTTLLLKATSAQTAALPENPEVEIRGELAKEQVERLVVLFLALVVRVGPLAVENLYAVWINGQDSDMLESLIGQAQLVVQVFGNESEPVRSITVANPLRPLAEQALIESVGQSSWSVRHFHDACQRYRNRNADPAVLWSRLARA